MQIHKTTWFILVCVVVTLMLSVTGFKNPSTTAQSGQQSLRTVPQLRHEEAVRRYPTAELEEAEPTDPAKRAALKERKVRNNEQTFSEPSAEDDAIGWFPERDVELPALPINESDLVLIGQVLSAKAHRSENKRGIFSEFEVRVDEVLKGRDPRVNDQPVITVERTGGFLRYPNGRKVLFFVQGYGMPEVGARNVLFLKIAGQGVRILTVYELDPAGVLPLDSGNKFQRFRGENEATFIKILRESIANARPQ
ncbi:MAG TPA: hypothetical protein VGN10_03345 [Pyrinomonadaceae bacterium]|jgi:hypothetical protein